jgi:uncharacterized coiled-coil protein SlyX
MTMLSELKDWLAVISTGGVIAAFIMMNWLRQSFVAKPDHEKAMEKALQKIEGLEDRASKQEGQIAHLPDKDVTHRMELALLEIRGDLNVMNERMRAVAATGDRLQEFLVVEAGKR